MSTALPKVYVFLCSSETYIGCIEKSVFGSDQPWPLQIAPGDYCLLHHYEAGAVFGLWQASTNGGRNLVPKAWGKRFPYQVKVTRVSADIAEVPKELLAEFKLDPAHGGLGTCLDSRLAEKIVQAMRKGGA